MKLKHETITGLVEWESSVNWLTPTQCQRLLELDGDLAALRVEIVGEKHASDSLPG